jgi:hypothetical protein
MIVYNITVKVATHIAEEWLRWQLSEQGPRLIDTGYFTHFKVHRLLDIDDEEGPTYAVQYFANDISDYQHYLHQFAEQHQQQAYDKWGNLFIAFRTIMEAVN